MLTCQDTEHLLDAYLDGELPASLQSEVHAHLLECLLCRQRVGLLHAVADVVHNGGDHPSPSPDFTDRVLATMKQRSSTGRSTRRTRNILVLGSAVTAAAAALLLIVTLALPAKHESMVLGQQQTGPGFPEALAQAGEHTRQTLQAVRGTVQTLGQLGKQALEQANVAVLTDLTEAEHQPVTTVPTELLFMGQLLIPLSEILELDLDLGWYEELLETSGDELDLI